MSNFFKKWGEGIQKITELQKIKSQINSTWIVIIGIVLGIVVMAYSLRNFWWIEVILVGSLFNTLIGLLGLYQRKKWLLGVEKHFQPIEITKEVEQDGI